MDVKEVGCKNVDWILLPQCSVVYGFCEQGNEHSGFVKSMDLLTLLHQAFTSCHSVSQATNVVKIDTLRPSWTLINVKRLFHGTPWRCDGRCCCVA